MNKIPKSRAFMLAQTANHFTYQGLLELCQKLPSNYEWALITHDLDDTEDHYHIAIKTPTPTTISAIAKKLNSPPNFVQKWRGNTNNMWGYLAHNTTYAKDEKADYNHYLNDPAKFATNLKDLSPFEYSKAKNDGAKSIKLKQTISDILDGKLTQKELLHTDNIHYYYEYRRKIDDAIRLRTLSLQYNPPNCKTVYIQGKSGLGKTNFATKLASELYKNDWLMASAGNDPLQDYTGQKGIIFDDWRPDDYKLNDLLALLDPYHRQRTHKSRWFNKALATELIIITSNQTLDEVIRHYTDYNQEDPVQIRRRIQTLITMTDYDQQTIERYNEQYDAYELIDEQSLLHYLNYAVTTRP